MSKGPKPRVEYGDRIYTCRRYHVDIPDLYQMPRLDALVWLNQNTTPTGYSRKPDVNIAGIGLVVR